MSKMRLIVAGAGGRMGRALVRAIADSDGAELAGALEAPGSELIGKDAGVLAGLPANGIKLSGDLWTMSAEADGILDFTVPAATIANVAIAAERGIAHIIGTTGLSASDDAVIKSVTKRAIVVQSGNMSLGVNLLSALVKQVAKSLDAGFDIEILEMHHKHKVDAPSGTALMLGRAAAEGRGVVLDQHSARGRDGITGERRSGDIGFASLRGNDHIRMLYVHPAVSRQGIATMLVDALEKLAGGRGATSLSVDASDTAQAFFAKRGYVAMQRNSITVADEWLANTTMKKTLGATP